jgi:predicted O-linked N-acetylglucosamine transferase (SPINDLY family)
MATIAEVYAQASKYQQTGSFAAAEELYRQIVQADPMHAEAWCALGEVCQAQGKVSDAEGHFRQALRIRPDLPAAIYNLAAALAAQGQSVGDVAATSDDARHQLEAESTTHNDRGVELIKQGKLVEASAAFQRALQIWPAHVHALNNLGNVYYYQGKFAEAFQQFRQAMHLRPELPEPYCNLGNLLVIKGLTDDAVAHYRQALQLKPDYVEAHCNLGNTLRSQGRLDEAATHFQEALRLHPGLAEAHYGLGFVKQEQGGIEEAVEHFHTAQSRQPNKKLRALEAVLLPAVYQSASNVLSWRRRLTDNVRQLHDENLRVDISNDAAFPAFRLMYQGFNDRDLQRDIGRLFTAPAAAASPVPFPAGKGGKIRIGFLSRNFRNHPVGRLMRGLMARLSRELFAVHLLSIGDHQDPLARQMQQEADRHVVIPAQLRLARAAIAAEHLDVLFYTDIGVDPTTYSLAFSRLAPIQCVTWGHPVTTGIPAIDYFISSQDLEIDDSDQYYTERLVRLKKPAICWPRPEDRPHKSRADFGLPESGRLYGCPLAALKFHPAFDTVLAELLRRDPDGSLIVAEAKYPQWTEQLKQRWQATMPDVAERIRFVALQNQDEVVALMAVADALLDPLHFGDAVTSYEALALGLPIITLPTPFLRSRFTYALYRQMDVMDCVASSLEEYVDKAVQLGTDADFRASVRDKLTAAGELLIENTQGVRELEVFLQKSVVAMAFAEGPSGGQ